MTTKFKVGDRVQVKPGSKECPTIVWGKSGTVIKTKLDFEKTILVHVDDLADQYVFPGNLELLSDSDKPALKAGDKVRYIGDDLRVQGMAGEIATVADDGTVMVNFPQRPRFWVMASSLQLVDDVPTHEQQRQPVPGEVWVTEEGNYLLITTDLLSRVNGSVWLTLIPNLHHPNDILKWAENGKITFAYASLQEYFDSLREPTAELAKREPKQGEIWQHCEGYMLLYAVDMDGAAKWISLVDCIDGSGYIWTADLQGDKLTFKYESLAAAVAAGETFTP